MFRDVEVKTKGRAWGKSCNSASDPQNLAVKTSPPLLQYTWLESDRPCQHVPLRRSCLPKGSTGPSIREV